jgi:hypothetical protein
MENQISEGFILDTLERFMTCCVDWMDGGGFRDDGHLFQVGCPGYLLHPGIPTASNVDLTTAPFRASPNSTVRR